MGLRRRKGLLARSRGSWGSSGGAAASRGPFICWDARGEVPQGMGIALAGGNWKEEDGAPLQTLPHAAVLYKRAGWSRGFVFSAGPKLSLGLQRRSS